MSKAKSNPTLMELLRIHQYLTSFNPDRTSNEVKQILHKIEVEILRHLPDDTQGS